MLKQRLITAAYLLPSAVLLVLLLPPLEFAILCALVLAIGCWEWARLIGLNARYQQAIYIIVGAVLLVGVSYVGIDASLSIAVLWWLVAIVLLLSFPKLMKPLWRSSLVIRAVMGYAILVPCWSGLNSIRSHPHGNVLVLILMVLIWTADSAAYFAGKAYGKRKLAPLISPGKSIEGVVGALIATAIVSFLCALSLSYTLPQRWEFMLIALVTVLMSIVGDLTESMCKRLAGVKDSSNLLPGHGGVLDRIDSLTAAAPLFALGLLAIGHLP